VRIVQYRAKNGIASQRARVLRDLTREHGALFILNDVWREVETYDADGAHLGPGDAAPDELPAIRRALRGRLLGLSCGDEREARAARVFGADYIGAGCIYATSSKDDAGEPIGIAGLRAVAAATDLPVAAIGGITLETIPAIRAAGVAMAAVLSAISAAPNPQTAAAALVAAWETTR
jgi:thiamine-phosphate pyrophosphorylase